MATREATCSCGHLRLACEGEPVRIAMCHCLACQQRTGSAFGVQAWFPKDRVRQTSGTPKRYMRKADSGRTVTFSFCRDCGGTVFWQAEQRPDLIAVAIGAFADPTFPMPGHSVWDKRQHPWTAAIGAQAMSHADG